MSTKLKPRHRIARYIIAILTITGLTLLILSGGQENLNTIALMGIVGIVCLIPAMMYSIAKQQYIEDKKVTKMVNNKKLSA